MVPVGGMGLLAIVYPPGGEPVKSMVPTWADSEKVIVLPPLPLNVAVLAEFGTPPVQFAGSFQSAYPGVKGGLVKLVLVVLPVQV